MVKFPIRWTALEEAQVVANVVCQIGIKDLVRLPTLKSAHILNYRTVGEFVVRLLDSSEEIILGRMRETLGLIEGSQADSCKYRSSQNILKLNLKKPRLIIRLRERNTVKGYQDDINTLLVFIDSISNALQRPKNIPTVGDSSSQNESSLLFQLLALRYDMVTAAANIISTSLDESIPDNSLSAASPLTMSRHSFQASKGDVLRKTMGELSAESYTGHHRGCWRSEDNLSGGQRKAEKSGPPRKSSRKVRRLTMNSRGVGYEEAWQDYESRKQCLQSDSLSVIGSSHRPFEGSADGIRK
ncbi:hypothetical protein L218DRAFT_950881 [Marasmius fiardii PR-910]|nr:hypothetical protein L218DRAFT_950881 [Marasmius fiardii PR-910]